jgi:hypothetical protein
LFFPAVVQKKAGAEILSLALAIVPVISIYAQPDYPEIFGNDWQKALTFLDENKAWIKPALNKNNITYSEAVSVVFPELVRYSALRDKMEITLLKTLYRNLGDDYADFSVGVFQVKPSFAERIIEESQRSRFGKLFKTRDEFENDYLFRASIIGDLEDPEREFRYVIAFIKICDKKFRINWEDGASKVKFLATAYNTGFWKSEEEIRTMADKKFFNTKLFKTENYSYADISLFWYNQFLNKSISNNNE